MQQADHRSFSLHFVLCCGILNYRKFSSLRAAMVLRHVSSNRCVAVCIYIFLCVEVVYGFHSVLGFFHFSLGRTRLPSRCLQREQKITIEQPNHPLPGRKDNPRTTGAPRRCFCRPFYIDEREFANYSMLPELSFRRLPPTTRRLNRPARTIGNWCLIHWLWIQYMFGHTTPLSCDCDG